MTASFAIAKAGHDKGTLYCIIDEHEDFVMLSDGDLKPIATPKKKNKKHIQPVKNIPEEIMKMCFQNEKFFDEGIKRALKEYRAASKKDQQ